MSDGLKGKRVALVGGAGFIGHHLALELAARGAEPHIIDGLAVNNLLAVASGAGNLPDRELSMRILLDRLERIRRAGIPLHALDARDYLRLSFTLVQIRPHAIVHLAAVAHAGRANKDPYSTFDHTSRTLENSLDCARGEVEHFVYFSSSMVYGNFLTEEVSEEHPLNPLGIYGALKLGGEKLVIAYQQVFGLPYTIVRPSALYGPSCISRRVVQIFLEHALAGLPLEVSGDGSERLDFTYVEDLVQGLCLVLERPASRNEIFNLTYGRSRSIRELVEVLGRHIPDLSVSNVERDALMPIRGTLSVAKAERVLGYVPRNPLEEGIPKYLEWYRGIRLERGRAPSGG